MIYKRFFSTILICMIITISMCPFIGTFVYAADSVPSGYTPVTSDRELAEAFNYYCKSRDLYITSNMPGASLTYLYNYIKKYCSAHGYNIDEIQENCFKLQQDHQIIAFFFKNGLAGISFWNEIFAAFIHENDLSVGDSANQNDNIVYSGESFTDDEGNTCFIWEIQHSGNIPAYSNWGNNVYLLKKGTYLKYTRENIVNLVDSNGTANLNFSILNNSYSVNYGIFESIRNKIWCIDTRDGYYAVKQFSKENGAYTNLYGCVSIVKEYSYNNAYAYVLAGVTIDASWGNSIYVISPLNLENKTTPTNIYLTTNNTVINNNNYEGDTIINNDGTPEDDGGGGGNNNDDDNWNPTNPTIPDYNGGGGSNNTINWPSIDIPDFNINFSLGNITEKFPFSIPFDLIALLTVLDGEPKAPDLDITIPLIVTDWHFEADFSQFDDLAQLIRAFEFIGFCVYLLYFTVGLVKG